MVDWSPAERLAEVLSSPWRAIVPLPDTRIIERSDWAQVITPTLKQGGMNEVARAIMSDADADRMIDQTIAEYAGLGLRFRWTVSPESRPLDLPERLLARGLESTPVWAMAFDVGEWRDLPSDPAVTIERVGLDHQLALHDRTMAEGWGMDPGPIGVFHRMLLEQRPEQFAFFLARHHGEPAGTASAVLFPRSIYFIGSVVLPRFRSRGVYRALVDVRLRLARSLGLSLASIHANRSSSAPILTRLGFEKLIELPVFRSARKEAV